MTAVKQIEPTADPVEHAIAWHDGDARAAIRTLIEDVATLRRQLTLATAAMGYGYTRGWRPAGLDDDTAR